MSAPASVPGRRRASEGVLLALDTSGSVGSVGIARDGALLAEDVLESRREHAARLVPAVEDVIAEAGVSLAELSAIAVGEGPGSFTGVRVAAATAKGLARGLGLPLWAVSSLAAAALTAEEPPIQYVLFDARGDRVYGACYGVGRAGVETLVPPHTGTLRDVLAGDVPPGAVFVGDGADRHRQAIQGAGFPVARPPAGRPTARGIVRFLVLCPDVPRVASAGTWEPRYLRPWRAEPG